jgi:ornithine carbamoyltransferase
MPRHFTGIHDFDRNELFEILALGHAVKARPDVYRTRLAGRTMAMIFEKSSTRTRVSFEVGMYQLGGHAVFLSNDDSQIGRGETPADTARVLSRYVDLIMARTYTHATLLELAEHSQVPVINALTEELHPCQGLADGMTLQERFGDSLAGRKAAWIGDGNNVAHSFIMVCMALGVSVAVASPGGYEIASDVAKRARALGAVSGAELELTDDPSVAAVGASAISTDVWASMGQEEETEQRLSDFAGFQVDRALMEKAAPDAIFLHCLPCHRGEEVAAEVVDGPRSVVLDQAENRLHVQKAVMLTVTGCA